MAVEAVLDGMILRMAADLFGVKFNTLFYHIKKQKRDFLSKHTINQVFTIKEEDTLKKYTTKYK